MAASTSAEKKGNGQVVHCPHCKSRRTKRISRHVYYDVDENESERVYIYKCKNCDTLYQYEIRMSDRRITIWYDSGT